jgi:DNA helicase II / ATP-dependent DNA helicase PcrA
MIQPSGSGTLNSMTFLDGLNPQQYKAVTTPPGPVLVLAGPGSGKTRVLTSRIVYLVSKIGARPGQILAVTFTNKAAREMRSRVDGLLSEHYGHSGSAGGRVSLGTFHSLAARILRREAERLKVTRDFVIFDASDQAALMRRVLKELNIDVKQTSPGKVHNRISAAKNELIPPIAYIPGTYFEEIVRRAYERYQYHLELNNALDFDDLLFLTVKLLREHEDLKLDYRRRYRHLLVDEFQDTNTAQYAFLELLAEDDPDLFVVGDPDQSIYRWRGADYRNVVRFQEDYPQAETILLEQNYRSKQNILDAAMGVIDRHPGRKRKQLFSDRGAGKLIYVHEAYDESDEAQYVVETIATLSLGGEFQPGDCAVMYRTNAQSRVLEEAFLKAGLPYRLVGAQHFYGRREVKDLLAYLRIVHNTADQVSLLRILNTPPRGLGAKTVDTLLQISEQAGSSPSEVILDLADGESSLFYSSFGARARRSLANFGEQYRNWRAKAADEDLAGLLEKILNDTHYQVHIDDGTEEGAERWANILELFDVANEFSDLGLSLFLEHVALISDQDTLSESQNAPTLLTLHAAKGLEFPVVIIIGVDDATIPHQRSFDDPESMAEERRLFYVGLTRAMDRLILVRAFRRRVFGTSNLTDPSRYLNDLPARVLEGDWSGKSTVEESEFKRKVSWESRPAQTSAEARFRVGMHVAHDSFGEGIVMESNRQQDDEIITVAFESVGIKRLMASLANLEVIVS